MNDFCISSPTTQAHMLTFLYKAAMFLSLFSATHNQTVEKCNGATVDGFFVQLPF